MASSGGVDLMLKFRFERGGDGTKYCRKMKRRHQAHLGSMGMKHYMIQRCGDVDQRRNDTGDGKGMRRCQLG
jgi:hypothetical protein